MRKIAIIFVVVLIAYSCRSCILEERTGCPSYLTLCFPDPPVGVENVFLVFRYGDGVVERDTLSRDELENYERPVRREFFSLAAYSNISEMEYADGYQIPMGCEADSLYTDFLSVFCDDDLECDTVLLSKDFIGLHIRVLGYGGEYDSVCVAVNSSAVGYDLYGNVMTGRYRHIPEAACCPDSVRSYYEYYSRILRQVEDNMTLEVYVVDEDDNELVKSVELPDLSSVGKVAGKEMEDLYIQVDVSKSLVSIKVEDWHNMDYVEIEM